MEGWVCVRRAASALLLVATFVLGAPAAASECGAFDVDGDGSVTVGDLGSLIEEFALLSECMHWDLAEAHPCAPYDIDGDARVTFDDQSVVETMRDAYLACDGALDPQRPECDVLDVDDDGAVDVHDVPSLETFAQRYVSCFGAEIAVTRCAAVDFDDDAFLTMGDFADWSVRYNAGKMCVGARVPVRRALWIDHERLMALPTVGPAWRHVHDEAAQPYEAPLLADQDDRADTRTLAKALVGVRLSRNDLVAEVIRALREVTHGSSDVGATALAIARSIGAYVIAADVIDLATLDPALDADFRDRLRRLRTTSYMGRTLVSTHRERPNNWGTHAAAARIAIALYLRDDDDLTDAVAVHRAWVGEADVANAAFRFGSLSWQADPARPLGINPPGALVAGIDIDGALPEEMRRGGGLASPPAHTGYAWEALQGATVAAELLARHVDPDAWHWGDDALGRAVDYLFRLDAAHDGWWAEGDDRWVVWLVNRAFGRAHPTQVGLSPGKNMGFTDWTHAD